jgi:hypothetical protein
MNPRYLETFRRHRILFVLTVVAAVVLATWASLGEPALYRSSTSLWSDTPTGAATAFGTPPPAAQEQTMLNELLTTQYFRTQVARGGPLAEYLDGAPSEGWGPTALLARLRGSATFDDRVSAALGPKRVTSLVEGPHVLKINFDAASPELALGTLKVLVEEFRDQRDVLRHDALATSRRRVERASAALAKARTDMTNYLQDNAGDTGTDPRLRSLSEAERNAVLQLATATEVLNRETRDVLSGTTGEATLRVIDPARLPSGPTNGRRKLAVSVLAGLFVGTLLSILGVFALTRVGRSDRPDADGRPRASGAGGAGDSAWSDAEGVAAETLAARRSRLEQSRVEPQ